MQVANISFQIDISIETVWKNWMKTVFIPKCIETKAFTDTQFYVLNLPATDSCNFTLQMYAENPAVFANFIENQVPALFELLQSTWGDKCFYFNTNMEIVN